MSSMLQKRKRGPNYSTAEKNTLLELVDLHKHIIENKKTDKKTTTEKQNAWTQIEYDFNVLIDDTPNRTKEQLKQLYESLKHFAKKENNANKEPLFVTGGGSAVQDVSDVTQKVISIISDQIKPVQSTFANFETIEEKLHLKNESNVEPVEDNLEVSEVLETKTLKKRNKNSPSTSNFALCRLHNDADSLLNMRMQKLEKQRDYYIELMAMKKEKHRAEMKLLALQIEGQETSNKNNLLLFKEKYKLSKLE